MNRLSFISLCVLALLSSLVVGACSDDVSRQSVAVEKQPLQQSPATAPMADKSTDSQPSDSQPSVKASDCRVGQVIGLHSSCTYPGTDNEFSVDQSGIGRFLFFTARSVINASNALINDHPYEFAARRQDDGSWIIEVVGAPSDTIRVSDLIAAASDTPTPQEPRDEAQAQAQRTATPPPTVPTASKTEITPTPAPPSPPALPDTKVEATATPQPVSTRVPVSAPASTPVPSATPTAEPTPQPTPEAVATNPDETPAPTPSVSEAPGADDDMQPAVIAGIGDRTVAVHGSLALDVSQAFTDLEEGRVGQFTAILSDSTVAHGRMNSVTGELTLTGLREGTTWVALKACDANRCTRLGEVTFLLTVDAHTNLPPLAVGSIPAQHVRLGETISVPLTSAFHDVDGDRIVDFDFRLENLRVASASVDSSTGRMNIVGFRVGSTSVSVRACDDEACGGENSALRFTVNVLPPSNQPPSVLASISDQSVPVGEIITLDISTVFGDPEGEPIQDYGVSVTDGSVAVGSMDSRSGILTLRGAKVGSTFVVVDASDGGPEVARADTTFRVTVTEPLRNPPTAIGSVSDQTLKLGKSVKLSVAPAFDAPRRYRIIRYDVLLRHPEIGADSEITRGGVLTLKGSEKGKSWVSVRACSYLGCSDFLDMSFILIVDGPG